VARAAVSDRRVGAAGWDDPRIRATLAAFDRGNAYNLLALATLRRGPCPAARNDEAGISADASPLPPLGEAILPPARSSKAA
jgi:hypothetical protein